MQLNFTWSQRDGKWITSLVTCPQVNRQAQHWQWHSPGLPPEVSVPTHRFSSLPQSLKKVEHLLLNTRQWLQTLKKRCRLEERKLLRSILSNLSMHCMEKKKTQTTNAENSVPSPPMNSPYGSDNLHTNTLQLLNRSDCKNAVKISLKRDTT